MRGKVVSRRMLLAIDQGTTGTTCLVFDAEAELLGRALPRVHAALPAAGLGRARRGGDLGRHARGRRRGARRRRRRARRARRRSASPTSARPSSVWDPRPASRCTARSSGRTAAPPRAATSCARPATRTLVRERTGLVLDPYFSATKIEWLLRNVDGLAERARDGRAVFGTIDSWLVFKLTGEHVTEPSNASRTLLYDIARAPGTPSCSSCFGVPERALPEVRPSCGEFGPHARGRFHGYDGAGHRHRRRPAGRAVRPGAASTRGSARTPTAPARSCSLNAGTTGRRRAAEGLLTTVAWQIGERTIYALEAAIFVTGAAVQWLRDGLGIIEAPPRPRRSPRRWTPTTASTSSPR